MTTTGDAMRIDTRAFALAAGAVAAVLFILCSIAVALSPTLSAEALSRLTHLALGDATPRITFGGFLIGLVCWTLGTALVFGGAAAIYNRLLPGPRRAEADQQAAPVHR